MTSRCGWIVGLCVALLATIGCDRGESDAPELIEPQTSPATEPVVETPAIETPAIAVPAAPEPAITAENLHDVMEDVGRAFQYLRRNMNTEGNDAALLDRVATMRALVAASRTMTPKQVERAGETERAALAQAYQDHLATLPPLLDELEAAIRAGDRAAAREVLNRLHDAEHAGHEALGVDH